jgi:hypothetical protein
MYDGRACIGNLPEVRVTCWKVVSILEHDRCITTTYGPQVKAPSKIETWS